VSEPAFYTYAAPEPPGFPAASVRPAAAEHRREISNFILPNGGVRTTAMRDHTVLTFFQSTYEAAADLAR
jgi:Family of unknown function (DUF5996)